VPDARRFGERCATSLALMTRDAHSSLGSMRN
jgi:hypothetical protein